MHLVETSTPSSATPAPSLGRAIVGFLASTVLTVTVMVMLGT